MIPSSKPSRGGIVNRSNPKLIAKKKSPGLQTTHGIRFPVWTLAHNEF